MRDYAKVGPKMWHGRTFKELRKRGIEGVVVATYLMTSPSSNMLGLYFQPLMYMAYETGLGIEGASKGLQDCIDAGFCMYDDESEVVWVIEMAKYQIANELKPLDKRCAGIQKDYEALPDNPFLGDFFDRYKVAFHLTNRRPNEGAYQAPCKPHRSQEQEQEKEQEKEKEKEKEQEQNTNLSVTTDLAVQLSQDPVETIFAYWQKRMDSPRSKLDDKRRKVIKTALKTGYEPAELCRAIRGCSLTPHNMGKNDRGQKYNGIELIFRSADQIDRFIANDAAPPGSVAHHQSDEDARKAENEEAKRLLFGRKPEPEGDVIDV